MHATVVLRVRVDLEREREAVEKERAVRKAGEVVVERATLEQVLRAAHLCDVLHLDHEAHAVPSRAASDTVRRAQITSPRCVHEPLLHLVEGQFAGERAGSCSSVSRSTSSECVKSAKRASASRPRAAEQLGEGRVVRRR